MEPASEKKFSKKSPLSFEQVRYSYWLIENGEFAMIHPCIYNFIMLLCESEVFRELRKADLHVHLNGAIPADRFLAIAQRYHAKLPASITKASDLQILKATANLQSYLRPWQTFKMLPIGRQCLNELVDAAFDNLFSDNVRYVELRNSPFNIAKLNNISIQAAVEWLVSAVQESSAKWKIEAGLILSVERQRHFSLEMAWDLLAAIKGNLRGGTILGMDVAGDETFPIDRRVSKVFRRAKDELGLKITIHAGEQGSANNIWWAVNDCGADRIGHGLAAKNDKKLLRLLAKKRICVEVCLQSNLLSGQLNSSDAHPVYTEFLDYGVPFVVCSDNPSLHNQPLSVEYSEFYRQAENVQLFDGMLSSQKEFAFSPERFARAKINAELPQNRLSEDSEYAVA